MNWESASLETDFRYYAVDKDWNDGAEVNEITSGKISRNYLSSLKESATLDYSNAQSISNVDRIRAYLLADGDREALGTFLVATPSRVISDKGASGTAQCYSVLQALSDDSLDATVTLPSGTNLIEYAEGVISAHGLLVTATASAKEISEPHTFTTDETWLDVVVWCCQTASYGTPQIDGFGRVLLVPYRDPSSMAPIRVYDSASRVMFPDVGHELDDFSVPNKVIVVSSTEDACFIGVAANQSGNRWSVDTRGRTVSATYTAEDLTQEEADAMAARYLAEQSAVESIDIQHLYDGSRLHDPIALDYAGEFIDGLSVTTQEISLTAGCPVTDHARRFVHV